MKKTHLLAASILAFNLLPFIATAADDWNTKAVAVMVVAPDGGADNRNFCWKQGVTVSVKVSPPQGAIVKVSEQDSKLTSFTDDKGTDLMAAPPSTDPFNKPGISCQLPSNDNGVPSAIVDLRASGQPAAGATVFNVVGSLNAQVASSSKQVTVDDVEIKVGTSFKIDDLPINISQAGDNKSQWGNKDYKYSVVFHSAQELENIATLEFSDVSGKKIEAHKSSWGGGVGVGYMIQYDFKQLPDHAKIVATCWEGLKTVDVPISVKVGVGL